METQSDLALLRAEAARLGARALSNEAWLVGGFLADGTCSPQKYLAVAARHRVLQRALFVLTEALLAHAPPPLVA